MYAQEYILFHPFIAISVLPLPALIDWTVTNFTDRRGTNIIRTITGFSLGTGYGIGLGLFFGELNTGVFLIGLIYATVAVWLLYLRS